MTVVIDGTNGISGVDGTASNPSYEGTDSNTGIFFPAADTIAFAEGGVEVGRFDSSANFQFNSGYGSVATAYGCRAWATFTPSTGTILASGNMTSVSRNSIGNYTATFTNAMPDENYAMALGIANDGAGNSRNYYGVTSKTASAYRFSANANGTAFDPPNMSVAIFR
jgi:hypothetical protein